MIFDAIIDFLMSPVYYVIDQIPVTDFTIGAPDSLISLINNVACYVPVNTFFICCGAWLILANLDLTIAVFHWVLRKIPTIN